MTIVDVCSKLHPKAQYLVDANQNLGYTVYEMKDRYIVILETQLYWRSTEIQTLPSGTYVFKDNEVYLLQ